MKRTIIHWILALSATTFIFAGDDVLKQLKITKEQAEQYVASTLESGYLNFAYEARTIEGAARVELVKVMGSIAKAYTKSEAFSKWYAEYREKYKPQPTPLMKTAAENRKETVDGLKKALAEGEKSYAEAKGDLKKIYQQNNDATRKMIKDAEKSNPEIDKMTDQYTQQTNDATKKQDAEKLVQWERDYPKDPRPLLKKRLQEFLDLSATVDFNAQLVDDRGKKLFAKPEYERKSGQWKQCFRIGKEPVEAGRAIAKDWLKEL